MDPLTFSILQIRKTKLSNTEHLPKVTGLVRVGAKKLRIQLWYKPSFKLSLCPQFRPFYYTSPDYIFILKASFIHFNRPQKLSSTVIKLAYFKFGQTLHSRKEIYIPESFFFFLMKSLFYWGSATDEMFVSPQNLYVKTLPPR